MIIPFTITKIYNNNSNSEIMLYTWKMTVINLIGTEYPAWTGHLKP